MGVGSKPESETAWWPKKSSSWSGTWCSSLHACVELLPHTHGRLHPQAKDRALQLLRSSQISPSIPSEKSVDGPVLTWIALHEEGRLRRVRAVR
jgi:hypothetical protein